ncbi:MAG: hypothetical protein AB1700_04625 [Bacillota bacterium]
MKKRMSKISITLVIGLAGVLVFSALGYAAEFSADLVTVENGKTMTGRVFVKGDKTRHELVAEGGMRVIIFRMDKNLVWTLLPGNKCIEIAGLGSPMNLGQPMAPDCDKVRLGVQTVNGHVCDVVQYVYKDKSLGSLTQWISQKLCYMVRAEVKDARGKATLMTEYRNIREEQLPDSLFEVPPGYTKKALPLGIPAKPNLP